MLTPPTQPKAHGAQAPLDEYGALLRAHAAAQQRCSHLLAAQAAEIDRLRAALLVRHTELAYAREDLDAVYARTPGLRRRAKLAQQVVQQQGRIDELERLIGRSGLVQSAPEKAGLLAPHEETAPDAGGSHHAVLCVGSGFTRTNTAQHLLELAGRVVIAHDGQDEPTGDSLEALETSLAAADLVICQTGCISHNAYWRVQDHCRRTGKRCVLVGAPDLVQPLRFHPPDALEGCGSAP